MPDTVIPKGYDYRNIGGYDFTGPLRNQKGCGSCYTMGFIQTIEARMKLKYALEGKKADTPLSPQFLLNCNYMNEGCDGGWAIFHGFLAENGHMVTEECAPYAHSTKFNKCSDFSHCPKHSKINKSYYVGGTYNYVPSFTTIQKELLMHGPLVAEIKAGEVFQSYKEGIMTDEVAQKIFEENHKGIEVPDVGQIDLL